jgi:hypothetical protein
MDWTGLPVQSVLLADADDWIRSRLQGMTAQLSDDLHCPQVIVVGSIEDPAAGVGEMTRAIMLECGITIGSLPETMRAGPLASPFTVRKRR